MKTVIDYFSNIQDPRIERKKEHSLDSILFITISAVICGAESWNDIERYGNSKIDFLKKNIDLPNGVPSHDTFNRVFSLLDPKHLEKCFIEWVNSIAKITDGEVISIDGKTICGSRDKNTNPFVHMVSAWANTNNLVLGQVKVSEKSNEITAIPKLIDVLDIKGSLVTIDAMGCQTEIAEKIIKNQADYILAVKGNQGSLLEAVIDTDRFAKAHDVYIDDDFAHGRIETRKCVLYKDLSHIENINKWSNLKYIVKIESSRIIKSTNKKETENRYYITSSDKNAKQLCNAIRSHWGVENSLHWILDVAFNEDNSQKRDINAVENFSVINRIALNLLKNEKSLKRSMKGKRLDAGWNDNYLIKVLKI